MFCNVKFLSRHPTSAASMKSAVSDGVRKWQGYHDNHKPEPRIHSTVVACKGTIWIFGGVDLISVGDTLLFGLKVQPN